MEYLTEMFDKSDLRNALADAGYDGTGGVQTAVGQHGNCIVHFDDDDDDYGTVINTETAKSYRNWIGEKLPDDFFTPDAQTAAERFVEDHPNLSNLRGDDIEGFYADYDVNDTPPGRGNIGTGRTNAESEHIKDNGYEINLLLIEPQSGSRNGLLVKFDVVDAE